MGITIAGWQQQFIDAVIKADLNGSLSLHAEAGLVHIQNSSDAKGQKIVAVHMVSLHNAFQPDELLRLRTAYQNEGIQLIQLWEDIWLTRPEQVLSRILSVVGLNETLHGRKTEVVKISKSEADVFFENYHLQGSVSARHSYGLMLADEIVAAASFSAKRNMTRREEGYTSVELIRFATKSGYTVQGGLSKLLKHHIKNVCPNDIMTYTDLDWSYGAGYDKLGFEVVDQLVPADIWLHIPTVTRCFTHRLPAELLNRISFLPEDELADYMRSHHYLRIFNTGSLKLIWSL